MYKLQLLSLSNLSSPRPDASRFPEDSRSNDMAASYTTVSPKPRHARHRAQSEVLSDLIGLLYSATLVLEVMLDDSRTRRQVAEELVEAGLLLRIDELKFIAASVERSVQGIQP